MKSRNLVLAAAIGAALAGPASKAEAGEMEWFGAVYAKFLDMAVANAGDGNGQRLRRPPPGRW